MKIEVEHEWTKERRTLDVETIVNAWRILVRWPLQGLYSLDLHKNEMRAESTKSRAKNPYCLWRAVDINEVRRMVHNEVAPDRRDDELRETIERHWRSMPRGR